jgi:hypothetical protein
MKGAKQKSTKSENQKSRESENQKSRRTEEQKNRTAIANSKIEDQDLQLAAF